MKPVIDVGGVSLWMSSFVGTQNNHKPIMGYFGLSCNARKEALCLASVTHMTRDLNDTFVTNHRDDRKPSFDGS